jgi:hypothetical protein
LVDAYHFLQLPMQKAVQGRETKQQWMNSWLTESVAECAGEQRYENDDRQRNLDSLRAAPVRAGMSDQWNAADTPHD